MADIAQLLDFFLQLGVPMVSIYAFSIDNFSRPAEEVDALMALAREKLLELAGEGCIESYTALDGG